MAGCALVKVALLSDCYLPRLGGIEVQVHDLAHHLRAAGHEVSVFTATGDPAYPRSEAVTTDEAGVQVHRFDLGLPGGVPINPLATREVGRRLAAGGFDVAHVHMGVVSPFAVDMARVALSVGVPTAVTWHCVLAASTPVHRMLGYAGRWAERGAALSAVSSMAAERVQQLLPSGTPVAVLGNGIDVSAWRRPVEASDAADRETGQPFRVVAVQRLARRKRPEALLDVLVRARDLLPPAFALRADIVGEGRQRRTLSRAAAEGDWITLRGRLPREDLRQLLWGADVFLSTTRLEAFGIAALEARTAGLPVIALQGNGIGDFVHNGVEGLLAPDDEGLAQAIVDLATDHDRHRQIVLHNRAVPPTQAWPDMVSATVAEYERARRGAQQ